MNELVKEKIIDYRNRHQSVILTIEGKEQILLELKKNLHFFETLQASPPCIDCVGDVVAIIEEWWVTSEEYDDLLQFWPYPKQAHRFPKGWAEARRLCIAVEADERPQRLYINRDAFTDKLVIASVPR